MAILTFTAIHISLQLKNVVGNSGIWTFILLLTPVTILFFTILGYPLAVIKEGKKLVQRYSKMIAIVKRTVFALPYLGVMLWFRTHNIFDPFQAYSDFSYHAYGLFRLLYLFYFTWLLYTVGMFTLSRLEKMPLSKLGLIRLDQFILAFFVGAAVIRIGMFLGGLLNLYYSLPLMILTIAVIFFSYSYFEVLVGELSLCAKTHSANTDFLKKSLYLVLGVDLLLAFGLLFIMHGQFIVDGDYFLHYNAYHHAVIDNHSIWPNQVWQHFFFSKGAGLNFLSIMLTDRMASPLVKISLFIGTVLIMVSSMKHVTKSWGWSLVAAITLIAVFLYFPLDQNYPGYFEKHHGAIGATIIAIVWLSIITTVNPIVPVRIWLVCGSLILSSLVILAELSSFTAFAFLGVYLIIASLRKAWRPTMIFMTWLGVGSITLIFLLVFNYLTTGLFALVPYQTAVKFLDQAKFSQWGSPYMVYYIDEGLDMGVSWYRGNQGIFQIIWDLVQPEQLVWFFQLNKLSHVFPHGIVAAVVVLSIIIAIVYRRRLPKQYVRYVFGPAAVMILLGVATFIAIPQPLSVQRQLTYLMFFSVLVAVALWALWLEWVVPIRVQSIGSQIMIALIATGALLVSIPPSPIYRVLLANRFGFFLGITDIAQAYAVEMQMPVSLIEMRKVIGLEERIVSTSVSHHYSLIYLMGDGLEMDLLAYSFGNKWHVMVFEEPEKAKAAYQEQGINYFFIDTSVGVYGAIPFSPLLKPENIGKYFKIAWSDDPYYVLTWRDPADTSEIPADFITKWKTTLNAPIYEPFQSAMLHDWVSSVYRFNNGRLTNIYVP